MVRRLPPPVCNIRVLVCGGRDFNDYALLDAWLTEIHNTWGIAVIIEGEAPGADTLARRWAESKDIPVDGYKARWSVYRRAAGPIRNAKMLKEGKPDLVLAMPGGVGTDDMVTKALRADVPVVRVNKDNPYMPYSKITLKGERFYHSLRPKDPR